MGDKDKNIYKGPRLSKVSAVSNKSLFYSATNDSKINNQKRDSRSHIKIFEKLKTFDAYNKLISKQSEKSIEKEKNKESKDKKKKITRTKSI